MAPNLACVCFETGVPGASVQGTFKFIELDVPPPGPGLTTVTAFVARCHNVIGGGLRCHRTAADERCCSRAFVPVHGRADHEAGPTRCQRECRSIRRHTTWRNCR